MSAMLELKEMMIGRFEGNIRTTKLRAYDREEMGGITARLG